MTCKPTDCPHADSHIRLAAREGAREALSILGVDIDSPKDVEEFRANLRFGASIKKATDRSLSGIVYIVSTAIVMAIVSLFFNKH